MVPVAGYLKLSKLSPMRGKDNQMRTCLATFAIIAFSGSLSAQESRRPEQGPKSVAEIRSLLLDEARKVVGPGLANRISPHANADGADFASERIELARRFDDLTREIVSFWLTRGLQDESPQILADRLSEKGIMHRRMIVSHIDAIASMTIFDSNLESKPSTSRTKRQPGDVGSRRSPTSGSGHLETTYELTAINQEVHEYLSFKFELIGRENIKILAGINPEQSDLAMRFNEITRALLKYRLTRDVSIQQNPEKFAELSVRLRQAIASHSEAILYGAILDSVQSDLLKQAFWRLKGLRSLLEPDLAAKLRLSKGQREMIEGIFAQSSQLSRQARSIVEPIMKDFSSRDAGDRAIKAKEMIKMKAEELDQEVWDALTPSQSATLGRILYGNEGRPIGPKKKPSNRSNAKTKV